MPLPPDQQLAKLRIFIKRAEEDSKAAEEAVHQAQVVHSEKLGVVNAFRDQFYARARELGYCPICEKPLAECEGHVWLAAS